MTFVSHSKRIQQILAELWCLILNRAQVDTQEEIAEFLHNPHHALRLMAYTHAIGLPLLPKQLGPLQTLAELAKVIETNLDDQASLDSGVDWETQFWSIEQHLHDLRVLADQKILAQQLDKLDRVEDIYPLSPLQQGMLFHTVQAPESGVYIEQLVFALQGELNLPAFQYAWQQVLERHASLRTKVIWEELSEPYQIVCRLVDLPWEVHNWRHLPADEQQQRLSAFLQHDRRRGVDFSVAPLLRLTLIYLTENVTQLVCSYHHLILDGWSVPLIFKDWLTAYAAVSQQQAITWPPNYPYGNYIAWLRRQNPKAVESFWQQALKDFHTATLIGATSNWETLSSEANQYAERQIDLTASTTANLQSFARRHQLTLNTLVQGAWALLLRQYSGQDDVVFGTVVSGRPIGLPGVEFMVGLFINTLPRRVRMGAQEPVLSWLKQLQVEQSELRQYEHSALSEVRRWSSVPQGTPLLESILVFENYPFDVALATPLENLNIRIADMRYLEQTNYPLVITIKPDAQLAIKATYSRQSFGDAVITQILAHFEVLLQSLTTSPERSLAEINLASSEDTRQSRQTFNEDLDPMSK